MKLIHETYVVSRDGGRVEWGYTFKREDSEDALFDLVLGEQIARRDFIEIAKKSWEDNKWAADAICAAYPEVVS